MKLSTVIILSMAIAILLMFTPGAAGRVFTTARVYACSCLLLLCSYSSYLSIVTADCPSILNTHLLLPDPSICICLIRRMLSYTLHFIKPLSTHSRCAKPGLSPILRKTIY
ncbi:hypothetical protein BCR41DRAFT_364396 [Lobosporangium transversale]|uniref:Uncharacterized protein n=1 Tax=Lobosporangium transversale TaxID=64571 RepID=A0A1Y2G6J2_9FUNG|nr:hypothetical protein BCR41DRAFT_364396 [Lobosporangium transversale]ORY98329.1 hypothetical protein BCR41DRAFT_364396 [Lobosporangium transversale]|eukprot:XP_021875740.1 hypothetical protein BCR41DRAFT_364396 [Lobosporangium transversale]